MQEFGHDPVMQEGQGPVDLLGREVVADRAPRVASGLIPFCRPQVELLLSRRVPGPQFRAQRLPHQMVVAEAGPLIIERHQEKVGRVNAVQQRRRVLPFGDGRARACSQLPQDRRVEHEPGNLGRLLIKDLSDEVLGDRVAADVQRPRKAHRVGGFAQRQRRHLQRRGPPLAPLMQVRQLISTHLNAEVRQQVTALSQGESQVAIADLAQLTRHPQPVQPHRRIAAAREHQLGGLGGPLLDEIGHVSGDRGRSDMEVVDDDR